MDWAWKVRLKTMMPSPRRRRKKDCSFLPNKRKGQTGHISYCQDDKTNLLHCRKAAAPFSEVTALIHPPAEQVQPGS
jgi:hypothetical protein